MQISLKDAICLVTVEPGKSRDTISFVKLTGTLTVILLHILGRSKVEMLEC